MSQKLKFIWIDDYPPRQDSAKTMAAELKVSISFKDVRNKDLQLVLAKILNGKEPDLLIIDHNLEDASSGIFKKGSTAATFIREQWPECPIICISGDPNLVDSQQRALYEEIIPIDDISNYYSEILILAKSFKLIKENRPPDIEKLIDLLGPPEQDRERLTSIIPTSLKEDFNDRSLIVEISRWIRDVLLSRPGFLYSKLWTATLLGLTPDAFETISKKFKRAKYKGAFANIYENMWWKSEILAILSEITRQRGLPWEKGRTIRGVSSEGFSKCYASNEDFPETVAFIDQSKNAREEPMRIKHTSLHPDYESLLFFDDIRLMTPAE